MSRTRTDWPILGRNVGTATGWDQQDTFVITIYEFEPNSKYPKLLKGDVTVDFEKGTMELYDDNGDITNSVDLVGVLNV